MYVYVCVWCSALYDTVMLDHNIKSVNKSNTSQSNNDAINYPYVHA